MYEDPVLTENMSVKCTGRLKISFRCFIMGDSNGKFDPVVDLKWLLTELVQQITPVKLCTLRNKGSSGVFHQHITNP
jgi:hypothetical protein